MYKRLLLMITLTLASDMLLAQSSELRTQINKIAKSANAEIGVAIKNFVTGDTLNFNPNRHLVMQSVFKLPLIMYTLHLIDSGIIRYDQTIQITPDDYFPTWSPIMREYPNANVGLTTEEIMTQTLVWSDNIGCDILFKVVGGTKAVNDYFHSIGINDISIIYNEREMHAEWKNQFANWCTPAAMVQILERVYRADLLSKRSHNFIWQKMVECPLGKMRLRGALPAETVVAHRTGTGAPNDQHVVGAVNDVGIIRLPDGTHLGVVVMLSNGREEEDHLESVIAKVAKAAYDEYSK